MACVLLCCVCVVQSPPRHPSPHTLEEESEAACKIQAVARGQLVRKHQKDQRLWEAWNELDWVTHSTNKHTQREGRDA